MEGELGTKALKYSMDLDCSSKNDDNSSESSKLQEDFLDTQELSYSVDLSDVSKSDQSESIPDLCLLKPHDFEPLVKKIQNNTDLQTTEATTKRIGNINWYQCGLCQKMEHHFCRTPPDDCFCTKIFYAGLKKETLARVYFCEFCQSFKNTVFEKQLQKWLELHHLSVSFLALFPSAKLVNYV